MTILEAFETWNAEIKPMVIEMYGRNDEVALSESWNDYTDGLCKDGELTDLQYHVCPAWDDDMPEDEHAYLLEALGVTMTAEFRRERADGLMSDMPKGSTHWQVSFKRDSETLDTGYSMGPAHKGEPEANDVFHSLLLDSSDVDKDFDEWASDLGLDTDSRKAERMFQACRQTAEKLNAMFSKSELEDLRTAFEDF